MKIVIKERAPKCAICGRLLWRPRWDKRRDAKGRRLGYNPGIRRAGQWTCYMQAKCKKRAADAAKEKR